MNISDTGSQEGETGFSREIGAQETRKLRVRRQGIKSAWSGFGVFGIIGWSVAAPTLIGALLGQELDRRYPGRHSWTLSLVVLGLIIGSLNAWNWISKQAEEIRDSANE